MGRDLLLYFLLRKTNIENEAINPFPCPSFPLVFRACKMYKVVALTGLLYLHYTK